MFLYLIRPDKFSDWSVENWKNLSHPNWMTETESSKKSCYIKNYDYEKVELSQFSKYYYIKNIVDSNRRICGLFQSRPAFAGWR